jgi:hypothetical protein
MGKRRDKAVAILVTLLGKEAADALVPDRHRERERGGVGAKRWRDHTLGAASEGRSLSAEEVERWTRENLK